MSSDLLSKGLDSDISLTHERFIAAMQGRLPNMELETKERYFMVLNSLVSKLEMPEKKLHEVLQEMMTEAAAIILQEMNRVS
jgi:hypothetical protein